MANTTITDLTAGEITNDNDCFVMDTSEGVTVKITYAELVEALQNVFVDQDTYTTGMNGKQNTLTFDTEPKSGSSNPVTSMGLYNAIGETSQIHYEQDYSSTAQGHNAGYAFTPHGAYTMYSVIMDTLNTTYATKSSVNSQIIDMSNDLKTKALPSLTTVFTIATTDWTNGQATVQGAFNIANYYDNEVVPTIGERALWDYYGVYPVSITATSITFECATTPANALTFKVMQNWIGNPA